MEGIINAVLSDAVWIIYGHIVAFMAFILYSAVYLNNHLLSMPWAVSFGPLPFAVMGTLTVCMGPALDLSLWGALALLVGLAFYAFSVPCALLIDLRLEAALRRWLTRLKLGSAYFIVGWLVGEGDRAHLDAPHLLPLVLPVALLLVSPSWFKARLIADPKWR